MAVTHARPALKLTLLFLLKIYYEHLQVQIVNLLNGQVRFVGFMILLLLLNKGSLPRCFLWRQFLGPLEQP